MRDWLVAAAITVTGCGRIDFDPIDAIGSGGAIPVVIQTRSRRVTAASVMLPVTATQQGNLLIVGSGNFNVGHAITTITDDAGNPYTSANALATWHSAGLDIVEIWYAANSRAGATTLTIDTATSSDREVWFMEVAGMDPVSPLDATATVDEAPATVTPTAPPVTTTVAHSVVVSIADVQNGVTGIHTGNEFTSLPILDGNNLAFYIASERGSYGAVWDDATLAGYCASTAAFNAAP